MKPILIAFLAATSGLLAQTTYPAVQVKCVSPQPNGGLVASFTFTNPTASEIDVPTGALNNYSPQPATFPAITPPVAFPPGAGFATVVTDNPSVMWTMGTQLVTASGTSRACLESPTPAGPIYCWDRNGNGICDPSEDVNHDGVCDAKDCQGPPGAQGPTGPAGTTGTSGPAGAGAYTTFRLASMISTTSSATVSCSTGETLISGGGTCTVAGRNTIDGRVANSQTPDLSSWQVLCNSGTATAMAICGKQ